MDGQLERIEDTGVHARTTCCQLVEPDRECGAHMVRRQERTDATSVAPQQPQAMPAGVLTAHRLLPVRPHPGGPPVHRSRGGDGLDHCLCILGALTSCGIETDRNPVLGYPDDIVTRQRPAVDEDMGRRAPRAHA